MNKASIDKLFNAADSLLELIHSAEGMNAVVEISLEDPPCLATAGGEVYGHKEVLEAMELLVRLGLVQHGERLR